MEKLKTFNERATKALGGTTKNLWARRDEDATTPKDPRDTPVVSPHSEKPQVAIHVSPPPEVVKPKATERVEERVVEQRRSSREGLAPPITEVSVETEHRGEKQRRRSSGPKEDMVMEQLSSMSQELANTKMGKQEVEGELKKLKAELEKLSAERDSATAKAQQQEKELTAMKHAVAFESVEKGQLEVRKLRAENVQLGAQVAELTEANSKLEKTLAQKSTDLQKSKEQETKLTSAMVNFRELQQKEAKASAELASASDRLNNITRNEETKLAAQRAEHTKALAERQDTHAAEIKKMQEDLAKLEETNGVFRRKAEGLARDLKKRIEKDTKDDELKVENTRLKEEVQRKSKSLADAMQEILQGGGGEGSAVASKLQRDLEDAKRQLGTLHEKEMTVEHLKSANVILSQRIVDLESQLKNMGVVPAGKSLVTSSSATSKDARKKEELPKFSPKAKHSDEDEELP